MQEKYYTSEQAAKLLSIHPKTVHRYIREGKLKANKVGKSWLITGHDLSVFAEGAEVLREDQGSSAPTADKVRASISAVADIDVPGRDEAVRIMNTLTAAMNCKPAEYGASTMQAQYIEPERKVRVMLWGSPRFMEAMAGFISALTDEREKEDR
jgi:excisionase family DNA binding protein